MTNILKTLQEQFTTNENETGSTFSVVKATAQIRMISTVQGKQLCAFEEIKIKWFLMTWDQQCVWSSIHPEINTAIVNTRIRFAAIDQFVQKLRSDPTFKRSVGGTKWSVDVKDIWFEKTDYDFWNDDKLIQSSITPAQKLEEVLKQDTDFLIIENS